MLGYKPLLIIIYSSFCFSFCRINVVRIRKLFYLDQPENCQGVFLLYYWTIKVQRRFSNFRNFNEDVFLSVGQTCQEWVSVYHNYVHTFTKIIIYSTYIFYIMPTPSPLYVKCRIQTTLYVYLNSGCKYSTQMHICVDVGIFLNLDIQKCLYF